MRDEIDQTLPDRCKPIQKHIDETEALKAQVLEKVTELFDLHLQKAREALEKCITNNGGQLPAP